MKLIVLVVHGRDPPDGIPPVAKEGRNKGRISNAKMFPLTNTRIPSINIANQVNYTYRYLILKRIPQNWELLVK